MIPQAPLTIIKSGLRLRSGEPGWQELRRAAQSYSFHASSRPGIILGTDVPHRLRILALLPTLFLNGGFCGHSSDRMGAVAHIGRLIDQASERGATEDEDYLAVMEAARALEDAYAVGRNAALRPLIEAALAAVERFRREVEP